MHQKSQQEFENFPWFHIAISRPQLIQPGYIKAIAIAKTDNPVPVIWSLELAPEGGVIGPNAALGGTTVLDLKFELSTK